MNQLGTIEDRIRKSSKAEQSIRNGFASFLTRFKDRREAIKILSVSSGEGSWDYLVATNLKQRSDITSTDIVPCPVHTCDQEKLNAICDWTFQKVEPEKELPYPDDCFDLVIHQDVIEHVTKPYLFLKEQYRVLKPFGFILFGTPNLLRPANIFKLLMGKLYFPVKIGSNKEIGDYIHIQEFNQWQLDNLMKEVGFKRLEFQHCFFGLHFLNLELAKFPKNSIGKSMCHHINVLAQKT